MVKHIMGQLSKIGIGKRMMGIYDKGIQEFADLDELEGETKAKNDQKGIDDQDEAEGKNEYRNENESEGKDHYKAEKQKQKHCENESEEQEENSINMNKGNKDKG